MKRNSVLNNPRVLSLLFLAFFFQPALQGFVPIVRYLDEFITIWALAILLMTKGISINLYFRRMFVMLVLIVVVGLVGGNFVSKIQMEAAPILNDIGNCTKVFITFMGSYTFFKNMNVRTYCKFLKQTRIFLDYIVLIAMLLYFANFFINFGMFSEVRVGIPSYKFIYNGPAIFSNVLYLAIPLLIMYIRYEGNSRKNILLLVGFLFLWILTLRTRAFLFVIIFLFMFWWIVLKRKTLKINFITVSMGIGVFILVCLDQIRFYIGEDGTARAALLLGGVQTMVDYFPFGAGFSTFGTDAAAKYYSPLYEDYGFNSIYGLSPEEYTFASDSFWPAIIGEFGAVGLLLYIILICNLFVFILRLCKCNRYYSLMGIFICFVLIVDSTASSTFFHFLTVNLMFILGICLNGRRFGSYTIGKQQYEGA